MSESDKEFRILRPKIDIVFKMLFGDVRNIDILTDFLQCVLPIPHEEYEKLTITDPHLKREWIGDKMGIVDVRLYTKSGKTIQIEIQLIPQEAFPDRVVYYNAKSLAAQLKSGDKYKKLKQSISIIITAFDLIKGSKKYHHTFMLTDKETGICFTDIMSVHTLELSKIPEESDNTKVYDWLKFIKSDTKEEFDMATQRSPVIKKAYGVLQKLSEDEEAALLAEYREKAIWDEEARREYALREGREKGLEQGLEQGLQQGLEQGLEQGLQQGLEQGLEQGRNEAIITIAKNLLKINTPVDVIIQVTGLTEEEIDKIR